MNEDLLISSSAFVLEYQPNRSEWKVIKCLVWSLSVCLFVCLSTAFGDEDLGYDVCMPNYVFLLFNEYADAPMPYDSNNHVFGTINFYTGVLIYNFTLEVNRFAMHFLHFYAFLAYTCPVITRYATWDGNKDI